MAVKVYVIKRDDRKNFVCQWTEPTTGITKMKSARTAIRREADRFAGLLESKINANQVIDPPKTLWEKLADRYEAEVLSGRAKKTLYKFRAVRKWVEKIINPKFAIALNASEISKLQGAMREGGLEESTIKSNMSSLRACLNWGAGVVGLLVSVPVIQMPTRCNKMKGRPLSAEEFLAYINAIEDVVGADHAEGVKDTVYGLWLSGLRIEESLRLTWEPTEDGISIEFGLDGVPRIRFEANEDKSTEARLMPVAVDFAAFLISFPEDMRHGHVFNPTVADMRKRMRADTFSKVLSRIGKKAKIEVARYRPKGDETAPRIKYASAHDLRRSFGTRWAPHLSELQLMELMRHKSIKTTKDFYALVNARAVEQATRDAMLKNSDISSDILPFRKTG